MRARLFLLLILLLTTTSFFWEDEQKLLRQLNQNGESALLKSDFEAAKKAFEELLGRISVVPSQKYQVDWHTYVDVAMRLAQVYVELEEKEEAQKVLALALAKNPPIELACRLKLMKAQQIATCEAPSEAYFEMNQITQHLPLEKWSCKEISFYHALEQTLDAHYDTLVRKAKLHLRASLYPEAIALYEKILMAIEKECYPKVKNRETLLTKTMRYRLAECHYLNANYEKSLSYIAAGDGEVVDREMIYLSALCCREKKEYEKALELFQQDTGLNHKTELEHYDNALFEMGHYFYQTSQRSKAQSCFEKLLVLENRALKEGVGLPHCRFNQKLSKLAALFLARIQIEEGRAHEVEKLLRPLTEALNTQDPLQYECYYLRGLAAFELASFHEARDFFERSLPCKQVGKWACHSRYHLGWCYTRLGDDLLKTEEVRQRFFKRAEESFITLLGTQQHEEACTALAQLYVLIFHHFNQQEPVDKLEKLLLTQAETLSINGQHETLLLRAEVKRDYVDKDTLYAQATANRFRKSPLYAQGWYCRGLNYFKRGLQDPSHDIQSFEMAAAAFEKAFHWADKCEGGLTADILKMEAKTHMCRKSPITSLALLEKLLSQFEESVEKREQTHYLRGLLASQLPSLSYFPIAEESLTHVIDHYPKGKYAAQALFALGTLYYNNGHYVKAQESFYKLATQLPDSSYAPEAWFWAAEAALCAEDNPSALRRHVYEDYPLSTLAAEAYFRQYTYSRYLEGGSEVIHHLKGFCCKFEGSPLEVIIHYLLGLHEEKLENAQSAFDKSIAAFSHYHKTSQIPDSYVYFYYRAKLELATQYLNKPLNESLNESLQECESLLCSLVSDFKQKGHALTDLLKHNCPYPPLFEEGEFKLVQCYLRQGKNSSAQKKLQEMLQHYEGAGIREGYYLSQVWQELGKLAMGLCDFDTALNCFEIALGCIPSTPVTALNATTPLQNPHKTGCAGPQAAVAMLNSSILFFYL